MSDRTYFCPGCGNVDESKFRLGAEERHRPEFVGIPLSCGRCGWDNQWDTVPFFEAVDLANPYVADDVNLYATLRAYREFLRGM